MQPVPGEVAQSMGANLWLLLVVLSVLLGLLVLYLFLMVRAVVQMLRHDVHSVLLTFAFLALVPLPPTVLLGIMVLIVWHYHKKDLLSARKDVTSG
jgi:hypothetical protein